MKLTYCRVIHICNKGPQMFSNKPVKCGIIWLLAASASFSEDPFIKPNGETQRVLESITVTGSLLPKGDFVSNAPVATISADMFEMSNSVNVEALINSMPQVFGGADKTSAWGQGIAAANLRGLGEHRTLVLVNSRRFVPTFSNGGTVDLNFVPVGLIERVELLTGGASAAYGSDALAGVINFILKDDIEGFEVSGGTEQTESGDGQLSNINLTYGGNFSSYKGTFLTHFDYLERRPIYYEDREFSQYALEEITDENGNLIADFNNGYPDCLAGPTPGFYNASDPSGFSIFSADGRNVSGISPDIWNYICNDNGNFNSNIGNYLQLPMERFSFKGNINYELNSFDVYGDLFFSKNNVPQRFPAGPTFRTPIAYPHTVSVRDNPLWSEDTKRVVSQAHAFDANTIGMDNTGIADQVTFPALWRGLSLEMGDTKVSREFETFQFELGVSGNLNESWGYEAFLQSGQVETYINPYPFVDPRRINQGLMIRKDGQCADPSNGCVPLNIWSKGLSDEALAFISYPAGAVATRITTEQKVLMATITGNTADWFEVSRDAGPIGAVLGFEKLSISSSIQTPDVIEQQLYYGFGAGPNSLTAEIDTSSVFSEVLIPLVSGKPFIDFMELEVGLRLSKHSNTGWDKTYKLALSYYPIEEVQIRVSSNKAIRSPSIDELFQERYFTFGFGVPDPCTMEGYFFAGVFADFETLGPECLATGMPEANLFTNEPGINDWGNVTGSSGGNAEIGPETAKTESFGVVWTPYFENDFSMSLDFYSVTIENYHLTNSR